VLIGRRSFRRAPTSIPSGSPERARKPCRPTSRARNMDHVSSMERGQQNVTLRRSGTPPRHLIDGLAETCDEKGRCGDGAGSPWKVPRRKTDEVVRFALGDSHGSSVEGPGAAAICEGEQGWASEAGPLAGPRPVKRATAGATASADRRRRSDHIPAKIQYLLREGSLPEAETRSSRADLERRPRGAP